MFGFGLLWHDNFNLPIMHPRGVVVKPAPSWQTVGENAAFSVAPLRLIGEMNHFVVKMEKVISE
jgi:hypothetical protein